MGLDAWLVLGVIGLCLAVMIGTRAAPDLVLLGGLALLLAMGLIPPAAALAGFSNEGVLTIAFLYVVAAGLRDAGAIDGVIERLLGRSGGVTAAQVRLMLPVLFVSSLMNNTPVVATFIPGLREWSRRRGISVSRLMLPLSYAAMLGGTCTLIGTSTNLVVNGLLLAEADQRGLGFLELAWVGVPISIAGVLFIAVAGRWLLHDRVPASESFKDPREYTVEMIVEPGSSLIDETVENVGLRHLPGLFLIEIDRDGMILPAVSSRERLRSNDRLVFAGVVESVVDLMKIRGLRLASDQVFKLGGPNEERRLVEAVVSDTSPMVGRTIREGSFRTRYRAVVLAVARNGERISKKIGDIRLRAGDTLLLETRPSFVTIYKNSRDFLLVSPLADPSPHRLRRSVRAWGILLALVATASGGLLSVLQASMLAAGAMVLSRCCSVTSARQSVDAQVLLVVASAFGLGNALQLSGAATGIGKTMLALSGGQPFFLLISVFAATSLLTNFVTNNAAAVLMFPLTLAATRGLDLSFLPFAVVIMVAASASFATPIGYQTNLMVYGPGGYRFSDYLVIGLPLTILVALITVLLVPLVWPLT